MTEPDANFALDFLKGYLLATSAVQNPGVKKSMDHACEIIQRAFTLHNESINIKQELERGELMIKLASTVGLPAPQMHYMIMNVLNKAIATIALCTCTHEEVLPFDDGDHEIVNPRYRHLLD